MSSVVSEIIAGATPIRASVNANDAPSAATARSHAPTMPMPPARTCPAIWAMTGLGSSTISRSKATIAVPASPIEPVPAAARSAPEQNTRPACVSTTARTPRSAPASPSRADSSATSWADSALRLCGESSVTVATSPPTSYRTRPVTSITP
jgi:hypothetical protein